MFRWLKAHLLCETRSYHASARRATSYVVNRPGYDSLFAKIHGRALNYDVERARQLEPEFRPYLDGTRPIPLTQKIDGGRLYGEHQWKLERDVRRILLKGRWDYDIAVAMPCLMIQATGGLEKYPAWSKYIGNRNYYRQKLASDYKVSVADAKEVFQLLFSLATFNGWSEGVGKVLGPLKTKRALKDAFLQKLHRAAEACRKLRHKDRGCREMALISQNPPSSYGALRSWSAAPSLQASMRTTQSIYLPRRPIRHGPGPGRAEARQHSLMTC